jgi:hypothetical protein
MPQILAQEQQILALLAIVPGSEPGETLEVQRQMAFMRKSYRVRNGGERPVRGGKQQFCSLHSTPDNILVGGGRPMDSLEACSTLCLPPCGALQVSCPGWQSSTFKPKVQAMALSLF